MTPSTTKFIKNAAGVLTEEAAILVSTGSDTGNKIPALNASGYLDATLVNSKVLSSGAPDAGKVVALDGSGKIDTTMMPNGMGPDTTAIASSEALSAGDYVNIWDSLGTVKVRKADASVAGKEAHGFVTASFASGAQATVYFGSTNTSVTGQTAGNVYLSTTAGLGSNVAPTASGNVVQRIGLAISATAVNFQASLPVTLA